MLWTILLFIITISILVTFHEFGHFWVARRCGVKVECFSIGFGKKLWSHRFSSGTEFVIAMIPLGGYVKMLDGRVQELSELEKKSAFNHKTILQRVAIVSAGPVANFLLAFIIYWVIFQLGVVTYPVKIAQILPNSPAATVNIPSGSELKAVAGIQIENWADVSSALITVMGKETLSISYSRDKESPVVSQDINIRNWRFDIEKESSITALGFVPQQLEIRPIVSKIVSNSAAEKSGLQVGDEIVSYNNKPYTDWSDFTSTIQKAGVIPLEIKRGTELIGINLQPTIRLNSQGKEEGIAGIYPSNNSVIKKYDFISAIGKGWDQTGLTIQLTVRSLYQLVTGVIDLKHLSGPITIAKSAGQTASYGIVPYLYFLAFISISLGVINLVPLPMLDGGHLLFLLLEKIKGQPISEKLQAISYRVGFVLIMVIMGIALFNDFLRL